MKSVSVTRASLPGPEVVNKLAENSVLGTVLAMGLRGRQIAEPRIQWGGVARRHSSRAGRAAVHRMERYLNTLGDDRLGGTVARPDGYRHRG